LPPIIVSRSFLFNENGGIMTSRLQPEEDCVIRHTLAAALVCSC